MIRKGSGCFFLFCLALLTTATAWGSHSPLLPRPQKIEYKDGALPVAGLSIQLNPNASPEDMFAATELDRRVAARTGIHLQLLKAGAHPAGAVILLERTGASDPLPSPGEQPGPESREAYRLEITSAGVTVHGRSSAAVFYGVQTLCQLLEFEGGKAVFPAVKIEDWPTLAYRATMVDMSEGQLATEKEVERQLDVLAMWKANQYYFYNEDSIELDGYPLLNTAARFTKAEIRRIIAYGRQRHIDVVPCLELYGHQHDLFRIEKYSNLADFPHGGEFDPANPKMREILTDWIDQYLDLFPSRFVNIGFDETWEIARAAKEKNATPAKLFLEQLNFVASRFQAKGKLVVAWGDIMVEYPNIVSQLPPGLVAAPWWYDPDPDPEYKKWLDPLVSQNIPTMVTPGVHMFDEIAPDFAKSFRNIDTFLAAGKKAHTLGIINTFWSDSQQGLRRAAWPGMAYGAAAAWQSQPMNPDTFFSEYALIVYSPANAPKIATALEKLTGAELALQKLWGPPTFTAVWQNPFTPEARKIAEEHREDLHQSRLLAEEAQENLMSALAAGEDPTSLNSLLFDSRMVDYAALRNVYALEIAALWQQQNDKNGTDEELWDLIATTMGNFHGRVGDMMDTITDLRPQYRENWLAEYTPFRLDTALVRWNMELEFWVRFQQNFQQLRNTYKPGTPLPAIETLM